MGVDSPPPDRDDYESVDERDGWLPSYTVPYGGLPSLPGWGTTEVPESYPEGERGYDGYEEDDDEGTWLDEGLISLILIAGVVLFVIPEPASSGLGIVLIAFGVIAWIADWLLS